MEHELQNTRKVIFIENLFNSLGILGILAVLLMALFLQLRLHELPCPLCLLQRVGFLSIAFGFFLNLRYGFRPSHYSVIILSAVLTGFIALRQVSLHIVPGTGSYGDAIFNIHLYTWAFIISTATIVISSLMLGVDSQYNKINRIYRGWATTGKICFWLILIMIVFNLISTSLECGLQPCPEDPMGYKYHIPLKIFQ